MLLEITISSYAFISHCGRNTVPVVDVRPQVTPVMRLTAGCVQVLLNIFADEIHRAHQRCSQEGELCDPTTHKMELVFEAGAASMKLLKGAYSCISMVAGVGLVAFRDPFGIR